MNDVQTPYRQEKPGSNNLSRSDARLGRRTSFGAGAARMYHGSTWARNGMLAWLKAARLERVQLVGDAFAPWRERVALIKALTVARAV